ncbi:MAG: 50S ribosome-binding GTPase [Verrucomicrobiae bacterium]|nr:50S ribosome-binding GTPase [Verrucomicrobiae bacterium]
MKLSTFTAENANAAVRLVQENLGPDAVIVSVRKLPGNGLARLLHREHIEVVAGVPDAETPARRHVVPPGMDAYTPFKEEALEPEPSPRAPHRWRSVAWLESLGLLPEYADRLEQKISAGHGPLPPANPIEEWHWVRDSLATFWRPHQHAADGTGRPHVFIGPPGVGKSTAICKWLTTAVLGHGQRARISRLDGETANTAEFLSLHCEMIGVPCERFWNDPDGSEDLLFVDLPGVEPHNAKALACLRDVLFSLPQPHVHLVLNAAYETTLLFEQFNAFAPLMPEDLIFTHLDEEHRRVKLWNFVLGTNCTLGWLAGGQKIPSEFVRADSSLLFPHGKPH